MKSEHLIKMLDMLTSGYTRKDLQRAKEELPPITNIGKLFSLFAYHLDLIKEHVERIRLWDNLDDAQGKVLDRYGANFGVAREGTSDAFYRLLIKVKMIAQLSGGDIDTVINAVASLYEIDPTKIQFAEIFPAKIMVTVRASDLGPEQLEAIDIVSRLIKRIIAAGVGFYTTLETIITYKDAKLGVAAFAQGMIHANIAERSVIGADISTGVCAVPALCSCITYVVGEKGE